MHPGEPENGGEVQVIALEGDGEGDQIEAGERALRFQGEERPAGALQLVELVTLRQEGPVTDHLGVRVHHGVDRLEPEVAHGRVVAVGVHQAAGEPAAAAPLLRAALTGQRAASFFNDFP